MIAHISICVRLHHPFQIVFQSCVLSPHLLGSDGTNAGSFVIVPQLPFSLYCLDWTISVDKSLRSLEDLGFFCHFHLATEPRQWFLKRFLVTVFFSSNSSTSLLFISSVCFWDLIFHLFEEVYHFCLEHFRNNCFKIFAMWFQHLCPLGVTVVDCLVLVWDFLFLVW